MASPVAWRPWIRQMVGNLFATGQLRAAPSTVPGVASSPYFAIATSPVGRRAADRSLAPRGRHGASSSRTRALDGGLATSRRRRRSFLPARHRGHWSPQAYEHLTAEGCFETAAQLDVARVPVRFKKTVDVAGDIVNI